MTHAAPQTAPIQKRTLSAKNMLLSLGFSVVASAFTLVSPAFADDYADISRMLRSNQFAEALAKADQFLGTKPRDPQMRFTKGVIQAEMGRQNDAIITFTRLTEDFPELPEPYNNLAVLLASQGQYDKARASLEMAIRTNPSYATAHENLGDVYARLASQAYSKALQLDGGNQAVQPKLALIRDLFGKGINPAVATPVRPNPSATQPAAGSPQTSLPATPAPSATPSPAALTSGEKTDVETAVRTWAKAWESKNMQGYFAAYGADFSPPKDMSRNDWETERRDRIVGKSKISLDISNLSIELNGNKATATFRQAYRADAVSSNSRKTLHLIKAGGRWVISREVTG